MPIYEYQCQKCKAKFEILVLNHESLPTKCSKCGGPLVRLPSAPAIQFKGSGWYVTDYARKTGSEEKPKIKAKPAGKQKDSSPPEKAPE